MWNRFFNFLLVEFFSGILGAPQYKTPPKKKIYITVFTIGGERFSNKERGLVYALTREIDHGKKVIETELWQFLSMHQVLDFCG